MTKDQMLSLPRKYEGKYANFPEREVALYVDGEYITRGPASQARETCRFGLLTWGKTVHPSRITWELDTFFGSLGEGDVECLCWTSGVRLSCEEMLEWLDKTR